MKTLHEVAPPFKTVVFYGHDTIPCADSYHDAFGCERWDPFGHDACIARETEYPRLDLLSYQIGFSSCSCENCHQHNNGRVSTNLRDNPNRHFFHYNIDLAAELPTNRQGQMICPNCADGRCPTIEDGWTRRVNPDYVNDRRDHREEETTRNHNEYPFHIPADDEEFWEDEENEDEEEDGE